jgi:Na+-driven multidrug efflux pump
LNFLVIAGVSNVILNFIFVKYFGMDADGVALATAITQYLAAFLTIRCLVNTSDDTRVDLRRLRICREEFLAILRYGLPSGISNAIYSLSNITIQAAVNSYGASAVAGSSTSSSLEGFVMAGIGAFNSAAIAFGGQNVGARKPERLKKIILSCVVISVAFTLILGMGIFLIGDPLYRLYVPKDDAAVAFAGERASVMLTTYFIPAFSGIFSSLAQVFGYSFIITAISIFGIFGFRIIWMEFVYPAWQEITTVYLCYPISWFIILVGNVIVFWIAYRNFTQKGILK